MRQTKQNLVFVFVVLCLFSLAICQGVSGGEGGDGGEDSSSGDYHYPSCQEKCNNLSPCVSDCYEQRRLSKAKSDLQIGLISGLIGGSFCIFMTILCILFPGPKCKCCYFHKYQKLKRIYQKNICLTKMSVQQFDSKCQYFLQIIKNNSIIFSRNQAQYVSTITEVQSQRESDFVIQVTMKGSDPFGTWSSLGSWICLDSGLMFWMYTQYDNKQQQQDEQTGKQEHLRYQSKVVNEITGIQGIWYYEKFETDPLYSGRWWVDVGIRARNDNQLLQSNQRIV